MLVLEHGHEQVTTSPVDARPRRDRARCRTSRRSRSCSRSRSRSSSPCSWSTGTAVAVVMRRPLPARARRLARAGSAGAHESGDAVAAARPRARHAPARSGADDRRLVGDADPDRQRGHALRRLDRHLLLPALQHRRLAAATACPSRALVPPRSSSPCVLRADERARCSSPRAPRAPAAQRRRARSSLAALVVQAGYLAYELHDYRDQLARLRASRRTPTPRSTTRCSAPTTRTSSLGILFSSGCSRSSRAASRAIARTPLRRSRWYWHFVNVVTLVVAATLLSARAMTLRRLVASCSGSACSSAPARGALQVRDGVRRSPQAECGAGERPLGHRQRHLAGHRDDRDRARRARRRGRGPDRAPPAREA